jgi:N-acetylglucosamine repressor
MKSMGEMRKVNTRNKILNIIRTMEKASKFQIQKISKYSMTTILSTVEELQMAELIIPAGKGQSQGGRRPDYFTINPEGGYFVGIEFNVVAIHGAVINFSGEPVYTRRILIDSSQMTPELLMAQIISVIEDLIAPLKASKARIFGIGVGAPGLVDYQMGIAIAYNNLREWHNINIKQILESHFGLRTYVDNNVNTIALGCKAQFEKNRDSDFVLFSIRKGIRISCVANNTLLRGRNNSVGEVGHIPVLRHGRTCVCGHRGCLDAETSNDAIRAKLLEGIENGRHLDLFESVGRDASKVSIVTYVDSVLAGHPESVELLDEICELLGIGLTHAINFYNPSKIIIYGEITRIGASFQKRIQSQIDHMAVRINSENLVIELAKLNYEIGAIGAATMVLENEFAFVDPSI